MATVTISYLLSCNTCIALRDAGVVPLAEYLVSNVSVVSRLNLGANDIGDEGGKIIGQVLAISTTLTHLELGTPPSSWHDNNLGCVAAEAIAAVSCSCCVLFIVSGFKG